MEKIERIRVTDNDTLETVENPTVSLLLVTLLSIKGYKVFSALRTLPLLHYNLQNKEWLVWIIPFFVLPKNLSLTFRG